MNNGTSHSSSRLTNPLSLLILFKEQTAKQAEMSSILIMLVALIFQWQAEANGLSNFNLVKVEKSSWTTDYLRTQDDRGPV